MSKSYEHEIILGILLLITILFYIKMGGLT